MRAMENRTLHKNDCTKTEPDTRNRLRFLSVHTIEARQIQPRPNFRFTDDDFANLFVTGLAEFPGLFLAVFLADFTGRRPAMTVSSLLLALSTAMVYYGCGSDQRVLVIGLAVTRGMWNCFVQAMLLYTPEAYPTNLRAVATGK